MEMTCNHDGKKNYMGLCRNCFKRWKYHNDEEYRERVKKKSREYMRKYYREHKQWNRERQVNYRKTHPDRFNYLMCRHYFKKLTDEMRKKLVEEFSQKQN